MKIRRVVTANDKEGKSYVKWDSCIEGKSTRTGFLTFPLWATKKLPVEMIEEDPGMWQTGITIGGGSIFSISHWEPGEVKRWHKTDTIDYAFVISGEICMQLDKEEVCLKAGDVLIQRATNHNWWNRGSEPCTILFVLLSQKDGKSTGWDLKYIE